MKEDRRTGEMYKCVRYYTMKECKTCDAFGRNLDDRIKVEECYLPKIRTICHAGQEPYNPPYVNGELGEVEGGENDKE